MKHKVAQPLDSAGSNYLLLSDRLFVIEMVAR